MVFSGLRPPKATSGDESVIHLPAADWLCLAAAPTFALMALVTYVRGGGSTMMLCSAVGGMSVLDGMVPMYVLMSALHVAPWLRLSSRTARVMWSKGYRVTDAEVERLGMRADRAAAPAVTLPRMSGPKPWQP